MSKECSIVRDLLPLYVEQMVSADTAEFVKEHLKDCVECREEYERMKLPQAQGGHDKEESSEGGSASGKAAARADVAPIVNLKRKLWKQKVRTILCTGLFVAALFVSAFALLSIPEYFLYEDELFTISENGEESITITFDERVTAYRCEADAYEGMEAGTMSEGQQCYQIEAWTSLWGKWFSKGGTQSVTIPKEDATELSVYYVSNDGHEDVCVYGEPVTSGGVVTLPRLVLSYYFLFAVVCAVVLLVIWLFVRRGAKGKAIVETVLFYPLSYCVAHAMIAGYRPKTYTSGRDFMFILFISILIYGGVLLARSIIKERKEIKALTEGRTLNTNL